MRGEGVAYAAAPRVVADSAAESGGRYVRLQRPPTRLLVAFDAEGKFATAALRRERRDLWVARLMQTLSAELQTEVVREQVVLLGQQRTEMAIVDNKVDLIAAIAASVEHERLRYLVALGQELTEHPMPRAFSKVPLRRRVIEELASAELGEERLLMVEQDPAEVNSGLPRLEHTFHHN